MVAERIVRAVIRRERTVYIPGYIWFLPIIQRHVALFRHHFASLFQLLLTPYVWTFRVFPYPILLLLLKISGAIDGMRTFEHADKKHD